MVVCCGGVHIGTTCYHGIFIKPGWGQPKLTWGNLIPKWAADTEVLGVAVGVGAIFGILLFFLDLVNIEHKV